MSKGFINEVIKVAKKHSPELLVSAGVVGMVVSTVMAVKATPKAIELIEEKKGELGVTCLTKKETVQAAWKPYVPATIMGVVSTACICFGTTQNVRRNTALATVYALSENTLKEYQKKTVELVGEEKAKEIEREVSKAVVKDKVKLVERDISDYVTYTGDGETLVFDTVSGRYFRSSANAIERAVNNVNRRLIDEYVITMNDFYNEINIPTIKAGSMIGYKSDNEMMDIRFEADVDNNGQPYLVLDYVNKPLPLYNYYGCY